MILVLLMIINRTNKDLSQVDCLRWRILYENIYIKMLFHKNVLFHGRLAMTCKWKKCERKILKKYVTNCQ